MKHIIGWICLVMIFCNAAASAQSKKVTYYYTDPQGNVLAETDDQGNVTKTYEYKPYGSNAMGNTGDGPSYTGHVSDSDTGLLYMQARYQDPITGRFLSIDPVGPASGNTYSFNRYSYANNNPSTNIDPDGRTVTCTADTCTIESHRILETLADYATVGVIYTQRLIQNATSPTPTAPIVHQETHSDVPALPGDMVGEQDGKSRQQGGRINNGPLSPDHGGTGDAVKDFENLTGGKSSPAAAEKGYPSGTLVGENGISLRPATDKSGPRIDIPANGDKLPETLHYPKPDFQKL